MIHYFLLPFLLAAQGRGYHGVDCSPEATLWHTGRLTCGRNASYTIWVQGPPHAPIVYWAGSQAAAKVWGCPLYVWPVHVRVTTLGGNGTIGIVWSINDCSVVGLTLFSQAATLLPWSTTRAAWVKVERLEE